MKIYTKTGDDGQTGVFAGARLWKDDARIEAYGTVDELNSALGMARTESLLPDLDACVAGLQHQLFALGAELATPDPRRHGTAWANEQVVAELESTIDTWDARLPPLKQFILPGGTRAAAALHIARGVCRRAERRVVSLRRATGETVSEFTVTYLNRLGDLLFVLARAANHVADCPDIPWKKP